MSLAVTCRRAMFSVYIPAPKQLLASAEQQGQNLPCWHLCGRGGSGRAQRSRCQLAQQCLLVFLNVQGNLQPPLSLQLSRRQRCSPLLGGGTAQAVSAWGSVVLGLPEGRALGTLALPRLGLRVCRCRRAHPGQLGAGLGEVWSPTGAAASGLAEGNNPFAPAIRSCSARF